MPSFRVCFVFVISNSVSFRIVILMLRSDSSCSSFQSLLSASCGSITRLTEGTTVSIKESQQQFRYLVIIFDWEDYELSKVDLHHHCLDIGEGYELDFVFSEEDYSLREVENVLVRVMWH
jgi:hypothetical protein